MSSGLWNGLYSTADQPSGPLHLSTLKLRQMIRDAASGAPSGTEEPAAYHQINLFFLRATLSLAREVREYLNNLGEPLLAKVQRNVMR